MAKTDVIPSSIVARIEFPNGAIRFDWPVNIPLPLPWNLTPFKESLLNDEGSWKFAVGEENYKKVITFYNP